ncbi:MAG: hypothetical protein JST00_16130 [Deltaproteobacteria bacterium]|nr:hypothetical protein [Deltaproteobacteria bacterium]
MTVGRRQIFSALAILGLSALPLAATGCKDKGQKSAEEARANVKLLADVAEKDVAEIERGLPLGGKKMGELLGAEPDPKANAPGVRTALLKMRREVADLGVAKSTFFAFTDDKGIAIRNDLEQDTMAGKDVAGAYPAFKKALGGEAFVATQGTFPGAPNPAGPDKEWVAAVPVKRGDGTMLGLLVTGWTYRRFAYHLQEVLKRDLQEKLMQAGDKGKLPVIYVFLFDKDTVYGARGTPPVNEKTLADLKLAEKTNATGTADAPIVIEDRSFGWAATRVKKLGDDVGIVVLRSEI